ncbi:MAG: hypothetical protein ACLPKI_17110 [Streptosporangiaceae bacterium]
MRYLAPASFVAATLILSCGGTGAIGARWDSVLAMVIGAAAFCRGVRAGAASPHRLPRPGPGDGPAGASRPRPGGGLISRAGS